MATAENQHTPTTEAELAQAFKELAKGENTASAMETQLASVEKKIDDLLASVDDGIGNGNGNGPHRHGDAAADAGVGRSERHSS